MNSALLGVAAALSWGVHDFLARFPSRAVGPIPTVLAVTVAGLIALSAWLLIDGGDVRLEWAKLWLVAVTGIFYALATLALFTALTRGPFSIVAPIAGSFPALAMILAVAQGARPSALQWLAIIGVMAGVLIVSRSGGRYEATGELQPGELKTVLGLAFLASFCFAIALAAGQVAVLIFGEIETVWLARWFGLLSIGALYLWRSPGAPLPLSRLPLLALMGLLRRRRTRHRHRLRQFARPGICHSGFVGLRRGHRAACPRFLKEPIAPAQLAGMVLIFGGVAALAGFSEAQQHC